MAVHPVPEDQLEEGPPPRPSAPPPGPERDLGAALHEVGNALTVVIGWIERARLGAADPEAVARALEVAGVRAAQARSVVRRAIGAEVPAAPPSTAGAVVADALQGLEPELVDKGLCVGSAIDPQVAAASLEHPDAVVQILTNLLLNAASVSRRGQAVRLEASAAQNGGVIFAVADEGPGVPVSRRAGLFHAGVTTRAGGAGIGLRHAASLARSFGGRLSLADSPAGARFELTWPRAPVTSEAEAPPPSSSPPASGATARRATLLDGTRILIVEDDDAVVDLLDTALTARGASVVSIRRHLELEAALARGPFDAALFDISPIRADIPGALARTRRAGEHTRLVVISGSAEQMPELPLELVTAWVRKPFEIAEIIRAIAPHSEAAKKS